MTDRKLSLRLSTDAHAALKATGQTQTAVLRALITRIADGEPLPGAVRGPRKQVSLTIDVDLVERARAAAKTQGASNLAAAVEDLLLRGDTT